MPLVPPLAILLAVAVLLAVRRVGGRTVPAFCFTNCRITKARSGTSASFRD
jgi:hypothetical protein